MNCNDGFEADRFSSNCAIPTNLNVALGTISCAVLPTAFFNTILSSNICTARGTKRNFWIRDVEYKCAVVGQLLWFLGPLLIIRYIMLAV
jgi:hypothetical protein